ncbi:hypothetical protein [Candidatus Uabimicrobium amorphum]|uniref:Uncharacterized protein n=1 Tax=Uabimicrobium amorphum TaxID=2596890 RepID=A0A5S9IT97_UABAM|nr:hypothetical protein [Candidatus Uabimicrobium amorphum]BBM86730.1 hypothetical protein UABAM_05117 [Candidatus Uabimicrobium amorphum]
MLRFKVYSIIIMLLVVGAQQITPCCIELKNLSQNCGTTSSCCHETNTDADNSHHHDTDPNANCCETENDSQQCCTCSDTNTDNMYYTSFENEESPSYNITDKIAFLTIRKSAQTKEKSLLPPKDLLKQSCILLC